MFIVGLIYIGSMIGIGVSLFLLTTSITKDYYPKEIKSKDGQRELGGKILLISFIMFVLSLLIINVYG